ncbi:MAG: tal, partial [Chloroflexi bacterium]|nr:tal [Chloroflexota bacterium]
RGRGNKRRVPLVSGWDGFESDGSLTMVQQATTTTRTRLHDLQDLGQSVWYDNISRGVLQSGRFRDLVAAGISGVTSNPTIFEKAITGTSDYDAALRAAPDRTPAEIFEVIATDDVRAAADDLRAVYDRTDGRDGYVSIEVSPGLAHDTEGSVAEARRLWQTVDRPNLMVKVPGTPEGMPAVTQLIAEGINVNITLIFALSAHEQVMEAYLAGLERRAASGAPLSSMASVASFFVSRVDTAVDRKLDAAMSAAPDEASLRRLSSLRGMAATANAVQAYALFREVFSSDRFQKLAARGARVQRPLWASTGAKDPAYSDIYYVESLAGADTVNTMPPATIDAFMDHGRIASRLADRDWANGMFAALPTVGIDLNRVTADLLDEGLVAFSKSFDAVLDAVAKKRSAVHAGGPVGQ